MSEQMYMENVLDHYKHPHNFEKLSDCSVCHKEHNPLCGDIIELYLQVDGDVITKACFQGTGCAISQASASMLTDAVQGKKFEEVAQLRQEDILDMLGIEVSALRLKCALLSLKTLERAVYKFKEEIQ